MLISKECPINKLFVFKCKVIRSCILCSLYLSQMKVNLSRFTGHQVRR